MNVAFVSSYVPRRCGLATFSADLQGGLREAAPETAFEVAAIDQPSAPLRYDGAVSVVIAQGHAASYRAAGVRLSAGRSQVVSLQHEFGLYGVHRDGAYEDHAAELLDALRLPVVTTLHTVLPEPEPWMRAAVRAIAARSARIVVMVDTAARLLRDVYGVASPAVVIPHGIPAVPRAARDAARATLRLDDREVVSTFGLVDARKGLEYGIEAIARVAAKHPRVLYLVIGQTHPEVRRAQGERYRESLRDLVRARGVDGHVTFIDEYARLEDIVRYLAATDVYLTPYLDPNQITSGTLAYALGAGKAVVSTPYLHAREALADGRGVFVGFQDAEGTADEIAGLLDDPARRARIGDAARAYAAGSAWPAVGARTLGLLAEVTEHARTAYAA